MPCTPPANAPAAVADRLVLTRADIATPVETEVALAAVRRVSPERLSRAEDAAA